MLNSHFPTAISSARFSRYLSACGKQRTALRLYRANITLSKQLYAVLGVFEIILRNSIDRHMKFQMGDDWLARAVRPGGHLEANTGCETSFHSIQEAIVKLGIDYSHDKLITKLSFGFWIFQFAAKQFAASGNTLLQIFVNRPYGLTQKEVFGKLIKMNQIRNKIAHQRSMCFDRDKISISEAELCYKITVEILTWLGCNPRRILYGIDNVQNAINIIKVIQSRVAK